MRLRSTSLKFLFLLFSTERVKESYRLSIIPSWQTYILSMMYFSLSGFARQQKAELNNHNKATVWSECQWKKQVTTMRRLRTYAKRKKNDILLMVNLLLPLPEIIIINFERKICCRVLLGSERGKEEKNRMSTSLALRVSAIK